MAKVFQTQDAKRYAEFGCKTCHGPKYQAPKDFLPKLTMKGGKFAGKPEVLKFMGEKVVPEMAAAMGEKPYDPATKEGFGCGGCHTIEVKLRDARRHRAASTTAPGPETMSGPAGCPVPGHRSSCPTTSDPATFSSASCAWCACSARARRVACSRCCTR